MSREDLLDVRVISERGGLQRVQRWWKGVHPHRGAITRGLTGWETVEEGDRVRGLRTFRVEMARTAPA